MDRLLILLSVLAGLALLWLAWRVAKVWLRRGIEVDGTADGSKLPTLLYFSSESCTPCHLQQAPAIATLQQSMGDRACFREVDAEANPDLVRRYRVLTVPTTIVVAPGGEVVAINYGLAEAAKLQKQLHTALSRALGPPAAA
jgi:thioredoxin 1